MWFFGSAKHKHLVVITHEGSGRLRLNGNRSKGDKFKQNAANHAGTVCWIEFDLEGIPLDKGLGPAAGHLANGAAERLLADLPRTEECRAVRAELTRSEADTSRWLASGNTGKAARGGVASRGKE
ncbi:MAG: hypothetical protein U0800_00940 [Isosphaeraceae bacterium]